jgi:hypothetical protein
VSDESEPTDEPDLIDEPLEELAPIDPTNDDPIETARRRYGKGGAAVAAGMFGLDVALGLKKKPESVQVQEAPTDPIDIDSDGIEVPIDATTTAAAPALERRDPIGVNKRKSRRS